LGTLIEPTGHNNAEIRFCDQNRPITEAKIKAFGKLANEAYLGTLIEPTGQNNAEIRFCDRSGGKK
jgi:hypothetical protein